jgi:hypothetical protein
MPLASGSRGCCRPTDRLDCVGRRQQLAAGLVLEDTETRGTRRSRPHAVSTALTSVASQPLDPLTACGTGRPSLEFCAGPADM